MAETFKNFKLALGTSSATAYTCPAATTAIVLLLQVSNIDGVNEADATVTWTDASDSDASTDLVSAVPVPAGSALGVLSGKLVLEAGDTVAGLASAASDLVLTGSVVELS
jgi:hypothetical protein